MNNCFSAAIYLKMPCYSSEFEAIFGSYNMMLTKIQEQQIWINHG